MVHAGMWTYWKGSDFWKGYINIIIYFHTVLKVHVGQARLCMTAPASSSPQTSINHTASSTIPLPLGQLRAPEGAAPAHPGHGVRTRVVAVLACALPLHCPVTALAIPAFLK